mmetsp:Transcript_12677/g.25555  ORF Transcript_12677/g.25555 Transcript_12677/m.25555 type:complete len:207 (-) Transcript_12677:114-734(-)
MVPPVACILYHVPCRLSLRRGALGRADGRVGHGQGGGRRVNYVRGLLGPTRVHALVCLMFVLALAHSADVVVLVCPLRRAGGLRRGRNARGVRLPSAPLAATAQGGDAPYERGRPLEAEAGGILHAHLIGHVEGPHRRVGVGAHEEAELASPRRAKNDQDDKKSSESEQADDDGIEPRWHAERGSNLHQRQRATGCWGARGRWEGV